MSDKHTHEQRSRNMAAIKATNTKTEIYVRKLLFTEGFRYRLSQKSLPGRPDIVLTKYKTIVFVHGCFWHRHNCYLASMPKTNSDYWIKKFNSNVDRDKKNIQSLLDLKWKVLIIWECAINGKLRLPESTLRLILSSSIRNNPKRLIEIVGSKT